MTDQTTDAAPSLGHCLRQTLLDTLKQALDALEYNDRPTEQDLHTARAAMKEVRSLCLLMQPSLGSKARKYARKASLSAGLLSTYRDTHVMIATCSRLAQTASGKKGRKAAATLPETIMPAGIFDDGITLSARIASRHMRALHDELTALPPDGMSDDVIATGLQQLYATARERYRRALANPGNRRLHKWRKSAKMWQLALNALGTITTGSTQGTPRRLVRLTERLGRDHDLAVLAATLRHTQARPKKAVKPLLREVARRRTKLQDKAFAKAGKLFGEKPKAIGKAWRKQLLARAANAPQ